MRRDYPSIPWDSDCSPERLPLVPQAIRSPQIVPGQRDTQDPEPRRDVTENWASPQPRGREFAFEKKKPRRTTMALNSFRRAHRARCRPHAAATMACPQHGQNDVLQGRPLERQVSSALRREIMAWMCAPGALYPSRGLRVLSASCTLLSPGCEVRTVITRVDGVPAFHLPVRERIARSCCTVSKAYRQSGSRLCSGTCRPFVGMDSRRPDLFAPRRSRQHTSSSLAGRYIVDGILQVAYQ